VIIGGANSIGPGLAPPVQYSDVNTLKPSMATTTQLHEIIAVHIDVKIASHTDGLFPR